MNIRRLILPALAIPFFMVLRAPDAAAQAPDSLQLAPPGPDSRVQTTIGRVKRQFTLVELRTDSIVLRDQGGTALRLALRDIDSLHVSRGKASGPARFFRGAATGFLILGLVGAVSGYVDGDDDSRAFFASTAGEKAMMGLVSLGFVGALGGGIIGALRGGDRWVPVAIR